MQNNPKHKLLEQCHNAMDVLNKPGTKGIFVVSGPLSAYLELDDEIMLKLKAEIIRIQKEFLYDILIDGEGFSGKDPDIKK